MDVGAFAESTGGQNQVLIINAMLVYDCKTSNQIWLLVLRNILYIESMEDNLTSSFILKEAGF